MTDDDESKTASMTTMTTMRKLDLPTNSRHGLTAKPQMIMALARTHQKLSHILEDIGSPGLGWSSEMFRVAGMLPYFGKPFAMAAAIVGADTLL